MNKHICPVCWQPAARTHGGEIWEHLDTARRRCEGGGQPFRITVIIPASDKSLRRRAAQARHQIERGPSQGTQPQTVAVTSDKRRCTNGCARIAYAFGVCRACRESGKFESPLSWPERVDELRALGYQDWEIAKKLGNSPSTFARQADRHSKGVDVLMREIVRDEKLARGWVPA